MWSMRMPSPPVPAERLEVLERVVAGSSLTRALRVDHPEVDERAPARPALGLEQRVA